GGGAGGGGGGAGGAEEGGGAGRGRGPRRGPRRDGRGSGTAGAGSRDELRPGPRATGDDRAPAGPAPAGRARAGPRATPGRLTGTLLTPGEPARSGRLTNFGQNALPQQRVLTDFRQAVLPPSSGRRRCRRSALMISTSTADACPRSAWGRRGRLTRRTLAAWTRAAIRSGIRGPRSRCNGGDRRGCGSTTACRPLPTG